MPQLKATLRAFTLHMDINADLQVQPSLKSGQYSARWLHMKMVNLGLKQLAAFARHHVLFVVLGG